MKYLPNNIYIKIIILLILIITCMSCCIIYYCNPCIKNTKPKTTLNINNLPN